MEKDVAKYPRIVFSPQAYEKVAQVNQPSLGSLSLYLREDIDTWRFLDFLNQTDPNLAPQADQLRVIRSELSSQLSIRQDNDQVTEKLVWLARYFNLVLSETGIQGINPLPASE